MRIICHRPLFLDIRGVGRRCKAVVYTPYVEHDGTVNGAIIQGRDVTACLQAQEALRGSAERYRFLFQHVLHGYVYCRMLFEDGAPRDFVYLNVNPAFERLTGIGDVIGKRVSQVIPGVREKHPELFNVCGRVSASGRPERFQARLGPLGLWFSISVYSPAQDHFVAFFDDITEHKKAEEALRDSESFYKALFRDNSDAIFLHSVLPSGEPDRFLKVNEAACRRLGYSETELLNLSPKDIDAAGMDEQRNVSVSALLAEGRAVFEMEHMTRDGRNIAVEISARLIDIQGRAMVLSVARDVTERRRAAESLQTARQMLQHVIDTVPNFVFWKDRDSRYLGCNAAFARLAGLSRPDEIIGKDDRELVWRKFADLYRRDDANVISSGTPKLNIVEPMELEDGSTLWLETSKVPLCDVQGRTVGVLGVFQDISERVRSEEKLRQAAKVFESTMEGVLITGPDGAIVAVNAAFTAITGYSKAEVLGRNPRMHQSGRHGNSFYQSMWASILQTGSWRGEIWNRRKTGEIYPEWLTINTVQDDAGKILNYVGVFTDISRLKRSEADLDYLAHHDPLTELPNRLLLNARLDYAIQRAHRAGSSLALLFLDLDRFKTVNDSLGHPAGDKLLKTVAALLSACVRNEDTVARLGGDEFVIVLDGIRRTGDAGEVAKKILAALNKHFDLEGQTVFITASIGISLYPADGRDGTTLLQNADAAMYQSKEEGRSTFRFYSAELTRTAHERLTLETELRRAIETQEFTLHFQSQVDVASGAIVGVEALVRWLHPRCGCIPPANFISLAEETGLILPLGKWVLNAACEQHQRWMASGLPPITLAVNLSPRQFRHLDLVEDVRTVLDATGLPPGLLELEITESAIMERGETTVATLRALKDLGVKVAIDDFGTGYSSLSYLRRFPIDTLKIDRTFMHDIPLEASAGEIAATIIAMARNLHLKVLAEGVETQEQLAFLQHHGCDTYQGFLNGLPLTAEAFADLLRASSEAGADFRQ